jgi:hypothetical protein
VLGQRRAHAATALAIPTSSSMSACDSSAVWLPARAASTAGSACSRIAATTSRPSFGRRATSIWCSMVASTSRRTRSPSCSTGLWAMTGRAMSMSSSASTLISAGGAHAAEASLSASRWRMSRSASTTRLMKMDDSRLWIGAACIASPT